jgi:hypothetical protein
MRSDFNDVNTLYTAFFFFFKVRNLIEQRAQFRGRKFGNDGQVTRVGPNLARKVALKTRTRSSS